jgi:hypothetical protein
VRRLTPEVFLPREKGSVFFNSARARDESLWVVKYDFRIFNPNGIEDRAAYVLRHIIEMMLSASARRQELKVPIGFGDKIKLKPGDIPYYAKTSRTSEMRGIIPRGIQELDISYAIRGFDSRELFWSFLYFPIGQPQLFIAGFVGDDDLDYGDRGDKAGQPERALLKDVTGTPAESIRLDTESGDHDDNGDGMRS